MTGISLRRSPLRATASVLATVLVCSCALAPGADSSLSAVKGRIEGVYSLEEWHLGAEAVRAPRVDGRFMLKDGAVITILHNRVQETSQMTVASYGSYLLDATRFSYRYDDTSVFVQTGAGITVSRKLPWDGMRAFAVLSEGSPVRLRSDNGLQEFLFTPEVLTYSENGKLQRVWRRIAERK